MIELSFLTQPDNYKIQTKSISINVNPIKSAKTDVVLFDQPNKEYSADSEQKIFSGAGEYELSNTMIEGVAIGDGISYRVESEHVSFVHLNGGATELTDRQIESLSPLDILLIPVSGRTTEVLTKIVSALEPKVVVLLGSNASISKAAAEEFGTIAEKTSKIKFNARDLPQDTQRLIILE